MKRFSTEFDYYKILGVARNSDSTDIKQAFRTLAKTHHPDKGGEAEHFKKLQESYVVLMDSNVRDGYDRYLSQYENIGNSSIQMNVPDWYEPNPHLKSEADSDPDLETLDLWPDARYFQDIIDGDIDRPKTLGWHKREERRQNEQEEKRKEQENLQEKLRKMKRAEREAREEEDRLKREKEYEDRVEQQQKESDELLEKNNEAEEKRREIEEHIVKQKLQSKEKSIYSKFVNIYDKTRGNKK